MAGFLNLLDLPYVGPDIMASSIGMDKILQKKVLKESGIPVVEFVAFYTMDYIKDEEAILKEIEEKLLYPVIVKPGNLGSSVGIKKASNKAELEEAIEFSMEFTDRIIVEEAVTDLKEINCAVLGNLSNSEVSVCEEPLFTDEILSYTDKYIGDGKTKGGTISGAKSAGPKVAGAKTGSSSSSFANKKIPADLTKEQEEEVKRLTKEVFKVLGCSGFARVDFLVDNKTGNIYANEINTIPGALSFYLWEASGKTFEEQLDKAIDIALKRYQERENLTFSYDQNILAMQGGTKGAKGGAKGAKVVR